MIPGKISLALWDFRNAKTTKHIIYYAYFINIFLTMLLTYIVKL